MISVPYMFVPIMALCCYLFLLISMAGMKKNELIRSFIVLIVCHALWTGGSMLMRMLAVPGYEFWYNVSILSLFCVPFFLYDFVHKYVGAKGYFVRIVLAVMTVIVLLLTYTQVFLAWPEFVSLGEGKGIFRYTMEWPVAILAGMCFVMIAASFVLLLRSVKEKRVTADGVMPVLIGMMILWLGNLLSIMPGNIFPFDTLSGIVDAFLLFYALYKKRLFNLSTLVSRGTLLVVAIVLVSIFFAFEAEPLTAYISTHFAHFAHYTTLLIALLFVLCTAVVYRILVKIVDNLFIKDQQLQAQKFREFSVAISKSLNLEDIMRQVIQFITEIVRVEKAYICLLDPDKTAYRAVAAISPLDAKELALSLDNPCIAWMREHDGCLVLRDFQRTAQYKAMWESEKQQLARLEVSCLVPLKCEQELVGVAVLTKKIKKSAYTYDDVTFLGSVQSIVSIAIKNANLYQQAYLESRIDDLTGLYKHKYFHEKINEEFTRHRDDSLALIILNLDDLKLYNQLYGNWEGDKVLSKTAAIIKRAVGGGGFAARYSAKEFAIVLPGYDTLKASRLAADIRLKVMSMNRGDGQESLKAITLSGGVCVYPYAASTVKELISNADLAVFNAKRNGKNQIVTYTLGQLQSDVVPNAVTEQPKKGYSEYAATIYALTAAIDAKDHYTFNHSQSVAKYATALAKEVGLNKEHVQIIYEAALLHDIGKIGIPEYILSKPSRLTDEEFQVMQKHVENSIAIIKHLPSLDYVIPATLGHHERWDGQGYPCGISGEDIPIAARCLAVADTFDAMTSKRIYRDALPVSVSLEEIERVAGTQLDPQLALTFAELVRGGKVAVGHQESVAPELN